MALDTLARRSGYSPFHFHRRFVSVVGETPKRHLMRLRLERAAYLVAVTEQQFLAIALDVGFRSHETFTRAFRRHFGITPTEYRRKARKAQAERLVRNATFTGEGCQLSQVRLLTLAPVVLLCARHTGAYAAVPSPPFAEHDELWAPLAAWALEAGITYERTAWVIPHDDPTVTPGPQQRMDAGVPVNGIPPRSDPFTVLRFAGGRYAGAEHVGPHETIGQAYRHVADGIRRSSTAVFGVGPPVQIFRHVDHDPRRHRTEVYFPIVRQPSRARNVKRRVTRSRIVGS